MAIYTTEVLVLGVKNWGNADKIVTLLSPIYGKITGVIFDEEITVTDCSLHKL